MRLPIMFRQLRRIFVGGVLAGLTLRTFKSLRARRMGDPDGPHRDVTGRKLAEEALQQSEARILLLAEKMSDLVCLHEPNGRYLYVSPSCRRLLGYEPEDLLGTDPYDLFHPEDLQRIRTEAHE